jgi:hypothetical protein
MTRRITADAPGVVVITVGRVGQAYTVAPIPGTTGFRLAKVELDRTEPDGPVQAREVVTYNVDLAGEMSLCDCPGFSRWANCKHVSGLLVLKQRGLI